MSLKIQIIIAVVIVLALAGIANMVRKEALDLKFALSWLAVGVIVSLLGPAKFVPHHKQRGSLA